MKNKKVVSIKELAEMSEVSIATVSRVINKKGGYSKETEEKILKLAESKSYQQNVNARSLRTKKSQTIGVIVPDISNEFFAKIIQAVEKQAIKYNYSVFVCNTDENIEIEKRQLNNLIGQFVDGIIYIGGGVQLGNETQALKIPMIYIDRYIDDKEIYIESDNFHGGYLAGQELIQSGCRKIAVMKDIRKISSAHKRYLGFLKALKDSKVGFDEKLLCDITVISYKEAKEKTLELLDSGEVFDGVFATNDTLALGVMTALNERRIRIPNEVKIVGFDNISASEIAGIPLTTINQNKRKMGELAVELLMDKILSRKSNVNNIKIPVNLIRRKSTEN
ncbi:LacI family DNA-binding transcriptional regulator [Pseudoleptotrichia goodfellowii]|uniref:Transcriptional regulator, LacI family n=2 Tax=Pseudoleptotrichia goodfellowii TaxID=157692 RepID=A0A510J7W4_9FUSO|nr:LacI family DNA-binding transcriptional regulator [Pseudoleptotrichia goodfellowii]BBM35349.1 transcriptional regulator, LacI family [Pseudoleptotrichia goodfellowii]